jgi:hypothetical protein
MADRSIRRSWRHRLRISVRVLIALVLLIDGGLGWFVRDAQVQRDAVHVLRSAPGHGSSGHVLYDWERRWRWWPRWLENLLGVDYFANVTVVYWRPESEAELAAIGRLGRLRELSLSGEQVTDHALAYVENLRSLDSLTLGFSSISDAGLIHLRRLHNLRHLELPYQITDAGMVHLRESTISRISTSLKHPGKLVNLVQLSLNDTSVTDAELVHLEGLTKLRDLGLVYTKVTRARADEIEQALLRKVSRERPPLRPGEPPR